jgi:nitric oxide reductase subunit B
VGWAPSLARKRLVLVRQPGLEYLEIGRFWQILLAIGLVFWFALSWLTVASAWRDPERRSLITFFLIAAAAIPVFYLPAPFFYGSTHYTIADTWHCRSQVGRDLHA